MNQRIGSDFDDFLQAEALKDEVSETALKRVIAWQCERATKEEEDSKKAVADKVWKPV